MSSKIEVSRELAEEILKILVLDDWKQAVPLAAILAAPVVERQPVAPAFTMPSNENSYGFGYVDGTCIQSLRGYRDHLEEIVDSIPEGPLFTAPPELAELQSTIARLESKLNRAISLDFERREEIAQQAAEIERLKGGQGEPVTHTMKTVMQAYENAQALHLSGTSNFCAVMANHLNKQASQPAPVSVVLPTLEDFADSVENIWGFGPSQLFFLDGEDLKRIWLECLDKLKELNQ
jgi:hypothetical protein